MRRTRSVATIGPASQDDETLHSLFQAGMNVCRLNYSHGEPEQKTELYDKIRMVDAPGYPYAYSKINNFTLNFYNAKKVKNILYSSVKIIFQKKKS